MGTFFLADVVNRSSQKTGVTNPSNEFTYNKWRFENTGVKGAAFSKLKTAKYLILTEK